MKVFNAFFTLYRTILYLVIALFILVAVGPMAVGIRPYVVLSASMEPVIMTGSLAYVQNPDSKSPFAKYIEYVEPQKGDIVAFKQGSGDSSITVVHRIYDINAKGEYVMKGDNNSSTDIATVTKDNIVGNFKFSIPYLGKVVQKLQSTEGIVIAAVLVIVAFASSFISDSSDNKEDEDENENEAEVQEEEPKKTKKSKKKNGKQKNTENKVVDVKTEANNLWGKYYVNIPYDEIKKMQLKILTPEKTE